MSGSGRDCGASCGAGGVQMVRWDSVCVSQCKFFVVVVVFLFFLKGFVGIRGGLYAHSYQISVAGMVFLFLYCLAACR